MLFIRCANHQNTSGGGLQVSPFYFYLYGIVGVGLLFFLLRLISLYVLDFFVHNHLTMFIYLPSGIRLLAVSIFGWVGIFGILLGWVLCYLLMGEKTFLESVGLGLLSGATAYLALWVWKWHYEIDNAFEKITSRLVISLVFISALISALVRFLYLEIQNAETIFIDIFVIGLTGDLLGSFVVLYTIKLVLVMQKDST